MHHPNNTNNVFVNISGLVGLFLGSYNIFLKVLFFFFPGSLSPYQKCPPPNSEIYCKGINELKTV